MKKSPRLPLWQSVFWIVGSVLVCSGISHKLLQTYVVKKHSKEIPILQTLSYIVQTGLQKEALHSDYLAELLGLSSDKPTLFSDFNEEIAEAKLLASPLFQEARVKKIVPNMVYVDYRIRKPIAWASDFINTVIDKEGHLFPMTPFFSPKKLPEIYLGKEGIQEASFSAPLKGPYRDLALTVLDLFKGCEKDFFIVKRIDVSDAFFSTLGKRGIVVILENNLKDPEMSTTHFLRLSTRHFSKEIANYLKLRPYLLETEKTKALAGEKIKEKIIDLRISQLAFVD